VDERYLAELFGVDERYLAELSRGDNLHGELSRSEHRALFRRAYEHYRPKGAGSKDFGIRNPLSGLDIGERRTFAWRVYDRYRYKGYTSAHETANVVRVYEPLLEEPNLFLEFAELYSGIEDPESYSMVTVLWIRNYGVLGLHPSDEFAEVPGTNMVFPVQKYEASAPTIPFSRLKNLLSLNEKYDDRGGPEESVDLFRREVNYAAHALDMYKAALTRNVKKLEEVLEVEGTSQRVPEIREFFDEHSLRKKDSESYVDELVGWATRLVTIQVQRVLSKFAYPSISTDLSDPWAVEGKLPGPQSLTASLWPRNLLGAMYIQFYWMITSGSALTYCAYCEAPISYAPTVPGRGKRKTYKNRKYCSKQCRQNYHYHNVTKPQRNGKQNGGND